MMMKKRICDLPPKLVGEKILSKVPITSVGEVRSTCKLWDRLTRDWIVGKEEAAKARRQHQFLGFVTVDFKVCSLRFRKEEEEDVDLSIKQGLLLCVLKDDKSKLLAWNPYLGQTRSISPRPGDDFNDLDTYLFGYDMNHNHKILRFHGLVFEMYELSSNSWRVLDVKLHDSWMVKYGGHLIVSLKGNAYFRAVEITTDDVENDVILRFDFTTETFGLQPLLLPFLASCGEAVTLSSVRDQKLALLHQIGHERIEALEIWITTKIDDEAVTWSKFMNVDMRPLIGDRYVRFDEYFASFFIIGSDKEEEEKVAVVFDMDGYEFCFELVRTDHYHTAFIIGDGEEGYYKTVNLGLAPNLWKPDPLHRGGYVPSDYRPQVYDPPFVCSSSYLPSLVQLNNQPRKRKERD
ncbi:F-box/kelch-repeat protein [Raphanus sativus]|nr:F-box/kelch-repeat protein [Raphanus sativus]